MSVLTNKTMQSAAGDIQFLAKATVICQDVKQTIPTWFSLNALKRALCALFCLTLVQSIVSLSFELLCVITQFESMCPTAEWNEGNILESTAE